jgi:lipoate-protein ligase A
LKAYSSQKLKEGKIIKVLIEFDNVITKVKISGDFFLHPEEVLDDIEKSMLDLKRDVSFETLVLKIHNIIKRYDAQMIGISPESLALVIREILK